MPSRFVNDGVSVANGSGKQPRDTLSLVLPIVKNTIAGFSQIQIEKSA
jgi:hypothetical protein